MNTFAAADGTHVVERLGADDVSHTPVVGWVHVQGAMAFPVTVIAFGGMNRHMGIEHPDGMVSYPHARLVFTDRSEWLAYLDRAPEEPEENDDGTTGTMADVWIEENGAGLDGKPGPSGDDVVETLSNTATTTTADAIAFGTKTFSTNSFWHMPSTKAIFSINGGEPYPKDKRCAKIKRDEFSALKREGWTVIDPRSGEIGGEEVEEPEDDFGDLV